MFRRHIPDLDILDSPILSPTPLSTVGRIPGSAIVDKIFNDPDAWGAADEDEQEYEDGEDLESPMAWLAHEIEKFRQNSAGIEEEGTPELKAFEGKYRLAPQEPYSWGTKWEGIREEDARRPISLAGLFDRGEDFSQDIHNQLTKILESGGNIFRSFPSPASSSDGSSSSSSSAGHRAPPSLPLGSSEDAFPQTPIISPLAVHSASTTLSFLEWYGIYPDTPGLDKKMRRSLHAKARQMAPLIQIPSPPARSSSTPSSTTQPLNLAATQKTFDAPESSAQSNHEPTAPPGLRSRDPSPNRMFENADPFNVKQSLRKESPIPPPGLSIPPMIMESPVNEPSTIAPRPASKASPPAPLPLPKPPAYSRAVSVDHGRPLAGATHKLNRSASAADTAAIRRLPSIPLNNGSGSTPSTRAGTPPISRVATPPLRQASPAPSLPSTPDAIPRPRSRSMTPQMRERGLSISKDSSPVQKLTRSTTAQASQTQRPPALRFASQGGESLCRS
ncbi:hypothetical protein BDQ12DRAFT_264321 [Crucibulum laeve]|uniref:Uncharacterized protein n=1 Tax=Crucibulum laeve TaxID=68775 RepID=A0A5C3LRT7_9AGAR|nr:hypothetical protein BDQ12DRAFT_264321 [Crucibulum laeve]